MKRYIIGIFLLFALFTSCGKEENYIPEIAVNFSTLLTDPRLAGLSSGNKAIIINGYGVAGLILYRRTDGKYLAYDRCSTVNPQNKCALTADDIGFTVTDPCTGAKFLLEDGSPAKAPAEKYLKQYNVAISNNTIAVRN
jgi:nitrite reductase/ring-hydroxylating ferredoxin subunit